MAETKVVAEDLLHLKPEGPRLVGGRAKDTGEYVFPMPTGPRAARFDKVELAPEGALWSYTIQRFPPKPPFIGDAQNFKPYAVGYVELPGQVIVESRIKAENFNALKIGMKMRITTEAFAKTSDGADIITYAFEPAA